MTETDPEYASSDVADITWTVANPVITHVVVYADSAPWWKRLWWRLTFQRRAGHAPIAHFTFEVERLGTTTIQLEKDA